MDLSAPLHEPAAGPHIDIDPVCGMTVELEAARAKDLTFSHEAIEYAFCGRGCRLEFQDDPGTYLSPGYQPTM